MRYFEYVEPDQNDVALSTLVSEKDIYEDYYAYWLNEMVSKFGLDYVEQLCSFNDCLEDFITVHWATEVSYQKGFVVYASDPDCPKICNTTYLKNQHKS